MSRASIVPGSITQFGADHEWSAWFRGRTASRLAAIDQVAPHSDDVLKIGPIGTSGPHGSREDRECDRCGVYVPENRTLMLLIGRAREDVVLVGGFCLRCWRLEAGEAA